MDAWLTPRRRQVLGAFGALGALGLSAWSAGCTRREAAASFGGAAMGTTWSVKLAGVAPASPLVAAAEQAVRAALDAVVARMSTFDEMSEVWRLNHHASKTPFALGAETLTVLARGAEIAAASHGAFDVTVAPLVGAWGFGAGAAPRGALPDTAALLAQPLGWRGLVIDRAAGVVSKNEAALQVDLSGIAKGHAVDRAAAALHSLGIQRYMVEAGGEIRTLGLNADGQPWQIAIERPDVWPPQAQRIVPLSGLAMATSGDYRNYWEWQGRRFGHTIDPRTRAPAAHALASVSVVHEECIAADAWATALLVLGADEGLALARERGLAALFIRREAGGGLRETASPAFAALA